MCRTGHGAFLAKPLTRLTISGGFTIPVSVCEMLQDLRGVASQLFNVDQELDWLLLALQKDFHFSIERRIAC